ncbi:MAG: SDR family oxidoreductase [Acidobacteriota bacterium]
MNLTGKTVLVTGGAHRLGKAIVRALAARGARLAIHYGSSAQAARQTVEELAEEGSEAAAFSANLAQPAAIEPLLDAVSEHFGRLDMLVNSAASFRHQAFGEIDAEAWDEVLAVNLRAPFLLMQGAAKRMAAVSRPAEEPAVIVNIGDLAGVLAWQGMAHHATSKGALLHLTRVAARELAPAVRVNAVVPGPILPPPGMSRDSAEWHGMSAGVPLARPGDPQRIGEAVVFLAENDYVTGHVLPVDGGEHLVGPVNH